MGAIAKNAAERKYLPAYSMLILTNGSGDEEGRTWAVTRRWMYDVGVRTFPWHLSWNLEDATQEVEGRVLETGEEFPQHLSESNMDEYVSIILRAVHEHVRDVMWIGNVYLFSIKLERFHWIYSHI